MPWVQESNEYMRLYITTKMYGMIAIGISLSGYLGSKTTKMTRATKRHIGTPYRYRESSITSQYH